MQHSYDTNASPTPNQTTLLESRGSQLDQHTSAHTIANFEADELATKTGTGDRPSSSRTSSASISDAQNENCVSMFEAKHQSETDPDTHRVKVPDRAWKNTFLRVGPLAGIFALLLAVLSLYVDFTENTLPFLAILLESLEPREVIRHRLSPKLSPGRY